MGTRTHDIASSYLQGIFAPIHEESTFEHLDVQGELPAGLEGTFVRNGTNPRFEPIGKYHWFDGDGMIHAMQFAGGKATYRNRYIHTKAFNIETQEQRSLWTGINMPVQLDNPYGPIKNTANTDVVFHHGKLLAMWWLGDEPYEVALPNLETVGPYDFRGQLTCGMAAHPKVDAITGEMVFMDYDVLRPPFLTYTTVDPQGNIIRTVPIDLPGPRLLHDLAITEHYTILLDFPMTWNLDALKQGKRRTEFYPDWPARFGILPRHGDNGDIRWFETDACYMYHTINAYEEGDEIVLTGCRITNPQPASRDAIRDDIPSLGFIQLEPYFWRWRFNLATGEVNEEQLDDTVTEFPRMNNDRLGRKTRYSYNARFARRQHLLFDAVIKYDAESGRSDTYEFGPRTYGSEVVFAPDPAGAAEDDGWLLSFTCREDDSMSECIVLDARDVNAGPVARIPIPQRVPIGYHAWWVKGSRL